MLKAVIVDDEPVLVRSLQSMISRAECGIEVAAAANDGVTGLQMIRQEKPDLVFVDISMPVMDGLALVSQLRQEGNRVPVVILSGYKEFAYAQKAVALDVLEYLVKPINPVEFQSFLQRVSDTIQKDRYEKTKSVLGRALNGNVAGMPDWVQEMEFSCWKICFGCFAYYRKVGVDASAEEKHSAYITVLAKLCQEEKAWVFETRYPNEFNLLLSDGEDVEGRVRRLYQSSQIWFPGVNVTVALGGKAVGAANVREAAQKAGALLQKGTVFAKSSMILESGTEGTVQTVDVQELCRHLQRNSAQKGKQMIQELLRSCEVQGYTQAELAKLLKKILRGCGQEAIQAEADYYISLLLEQAQDYDSLQVKIGELLFTSGASGDFTLNERSSRVIMDSVARYLTEHASEHISMQAVARDFGFNYTYMSYLFKKSMGVSPNEYLTQRRIALAKDMLAKGEVSVKEISAAVGYEDPYYFSRVFKSTAGLSPSDYRKQFYK